MGQSRVEDILQAMIDGTSSSELPAAQSRNEELLKQVLEKMNDTVDDVSDLRTEIGNLTNLKTTSKSNIVSAINELYDLIAGTKTLTAIDCVFTQGQTIIYNTDTLDSLKQYLVVTASYTDGTSETLASTDYTLSGTLSVGTSTITATYEGKTDTFMVTVTQNTTAVDVVLFAGQSNMDGRGTAADAPTVQQGTAYLWNASNNTVVDFVAEGSLIPAFVKTYFENENVPIVEVKEAEGGTSISTYVSVNLPNAKTKLENCINYLENHGKQVRRCFMLWNQGENDVADGTSTSAYESAFATLKSGVMASGVEDIFIINIGQASNGNYDFSPIRTALADVCNGSDVVMVSDKFYNATDYMQDTWHYNQVVYNTVGEDAAKNTVAFFNGQTISIKKFDASDVYGVPETYGTLNDWNYILHSTRVVLTGYIGLDPDVRVYHMYLYNGSYYEARLAKATSPSNSVFYNNSVIETITVDDGVLLINHSNFNEAANQQNMGNFFQNMTALTSVTLGNTPAAIVDMSYAFKGCTNDVQINFLSRTSGNFREAFRNTRITHCGDLNDVTRADGLFQEDNALIDIGDVSGTYTDISSAFRGCSSLETVGVFKSTALTNIGSMFYGCTKLSGTIKFLSSSISNATGTFNNVDLTKVEIQVPANSTSYTTITTAWPNANVTTF